MTTRTVLAAVALGTVAATSFASPAGAAEGRGLEAARTRCEGSIDRRVTELDRLKLRVQQADEPLTDAHQSTLTTLLADQRSGLTSLRATVTAASDRTALRDACAKVVPDHRVFVLTRPKVHLTVAGDTEATAAAVLTTKAGVLQEAANAQKAAGRDVTAAQQAIDAAKAKATSASSIATPLGDTMLALTPAGEPGDRTTVKATRDAVVRARTDLKAGVASAREAKRLLGA